MAKGIGIPYQIIEQSFAIFWLHDFNHSFIPLMKVGITFPCKKSLVLKKSQPCMHHISEGKSDSLIAGQFDILFLKALELDSLKSAQLDSLIASMLDSLKAGQFDISKSVNLHSFVAALHCLIA